MNKELAWTIFDKYFDDNPTALVNHHLESYNDFFSTDINQIFREKNPIKIVKQQNPETKDYKFKANIYFGGKEGNKIYFGKPIIFDEHQEHYMYPNEARLRNMTYGVSIHYDVDVEFIILNEEEIPITTNYTLDKIYLGRFPIMLRSNLCILNGFDKNVRFTMGECRNDSGGYFIVDGKEKCIISQEKFADNMLYIKDTVNDLYSHSAEIRSVSEDASKPIRTLSIRIMSPSTVLSNNQIVVNVPNVRKPVPLFILMRALGILSDKEIIQCCLLDLELYKNYIDLFIPSIHDAGMIFTQKTALAYIGTFTKRKSKAAVMEILMNYLLPNVGELNFRDKACFIGYMVRELLKVYTKEKKPTDRDSFKYKRIELPGSLIYDLFKEYYTLQQRNIFQKIDKEYYYKQGIYQSNFESLIKNNYNDFFSSRIVEEGFRKAFKGNWGAEEHTKRLGIVQDINRLSFNSYISLMRKINLPLDSGAKIIGPRLLHSSQWGIIDPVDTPDGGNIGLHKHMSILAKITKKCSSHRIILWLRTNTNMRVLNECSFSYLGESTKIIINGTWVGVVDDPVNVKNILVNARRSALIPIYTSIAWEIKSNTIFIATDYGRLCHPIYYINTDNKISIDNTIILDKIHRNNFTWNNLISGFIEKKNFNINDCGVYLNVNDLYPSTSPESLQNNRAVIEYIDTAESETALICIHTDDIDKKPYTHMEIHPSLILGVMGNQIIFPENNPLPRDLFSCSQSKQAISIYHTNYTSRFDKVGVILNYGQLPLVKSRYYKYINNEEHSYGINAIVAIACYGGYNVEDAVLFNRASLDRGIFRNTYYNTYETREESSKVGNSTIDSRFANVEKVNIVGMKPGYDYSDLDDAGLIKENTLLDEKKVLIGKIQTNLSNPEISLDSSIFPKKGQLGYVDKTFITEGEEGYRIAKVRVRDDRIPAIGDKFCSRCGQKGTVGLVIEEQDMPFTAEGIRPDIIINPHALPSRMTIGQLLETVMGKTCAEYGAFGESTAFNNNGAKYKSFGKLLTKLGYSSSSNELLYNGQSGEQMQADIFIGPTYYMRLKHLVKDKINYRAKGPRTVLTRQTVQGRANDGGLRVGELERDAIVAHGLSYFLKESLLVRGDDYYMAVCNVTGMIAIYNPNINLFMSPFADGPIKYVGELDDTLKIDKLTRFGRSFSVIRIPYAFKLLIQELSTLNVNLRIITADNIEQISSMSFGAHIGNLQESKTASTPIESKSDYTETFGPLETIDSEQKPTLESSLIEDEMKKLPIKQTEGSPRLITGNTTAIQGVGFDELARSQLPTSPPQESEVSSLSNTTSPSTQSVDSTPTKNESKESKESKESNESNESKESNESDDLENSKLKLFTDITSEPDEDSTTNKKTIQMN
jgi:DNA-directed RNA polymerase II subunit RPB2